MFVLYSETFVHKISIIYARTDSTKNTNSSNVSFFYCFKFSTDKSSGKRTYQLRSKVVGNGYKSKKKRKRT